VPARAKVRPELRWSRAAAWIAVVSGGASGLCLIALVLHTIRGPDDGVVKTLLATMGVTAVVALAAAAPSLREPRLRPLAMEGIEMAFVALMVLALLAFFFYVMLGPGYS